MSQPTEFALFYQCVPGDFPPLLKTYPLSLLKEFPGSAKIPGLDRVREGELRVKEETDEFRRFEFDFTFRKGRSAIETLKPLETRGHFEFWQHRVGGLVLTLKSSALFSKTPISLLAASVYRNLGAIKQVELGKDKLLSLRQHVLGLGGHTTLIHVRGVKSESGFFDYFQVKGRNLDENFVERMLEVARGITRIGFLVELGRTPFSFWVADWGGGNIYRPVFNPIEHVPIFVKFFEEALPELVYRPQEEFSKLRSDL